MSNNVIELFPPAKVVERPSSVDVTGLIDVIHTWAIEQGIDVQNDAGFEIRVADLMAQLQIMAKMSRAACI